MFDKAISAMRKVGNDVVDWLLSSGRLRETRAKYTYNLLFKSDHVTNNVCEIFNSWSGDDQKEDHIVYDWEFEVKVDEISLEKEWECNHGW